MQPPPAEPAKKDNRKIAPYAENVLLHRGYRYDRDETGSAHFHYRIGRPLSFAVDDGITFLANIQQEAAYCCHH